MCCIGQVLFTLIRRYLINKKGALGEAAGAACTIRGLSDRTADVWAAIGRSEFEIALSNPGALDRELQALAGAATKVFDFAIDLRLNKNAALDAFDLVPVLAKPAVRPHAVCRSPAEAPT